MSHLFTFSTLLILLLLTNKSQNIKLTHKTDLLLTFRMAYSIAKPRCETNGFSFFKISVGLLIGNVNLDNVKKAVKLAV